jgi:acetyl esterase/lipase
MSNTSRHPISLKPIVYRLPGADSGEATLDVEYRVSEAGPLTMDVYRPAEAGETARPPVVVLVTGYPDIGVPRPLGCAFKEMASVVSLARLLAASGVAAVAYTASDPVADGEAVLDSLKRQADALKIDPSRTAVWATSGHVPLALGLLTRNRGSIAAAVLLNGFMFDVNGAVAAAARAYRFAYPIGDKSVPDLAAHVPLFIVRSGRDEFVGVNASIDRFLAEAVEYNLPITFVNHATAPHAFDINDDSPTSRHVLAQAVRFLRLHLLEEAEGAEETDSHGETE